MLYYYCDKDCLVSMYRSHEFWVSGREIVRLTIIFGATHPSTITQEWKNLKTQLIVNYYFSKFVLHRYLKCKRAVYH